MSGRRRVRHVGTDRPPETGSTAYARAETQFNGADNHFRAAQLQAGLRRQQGPTTDHLGTVDAFVGDRQNAEGSRTTGIGAHGRLAGTQLSLGTPGEGWRGAFSADFLGADGELSAASSGTAQASAQNYVAQAALELGWNRPTSAHGFMLRGGLSAGEGGALRLHATDEDSDGVSEVGFGADLGPFSFDIRTEDLDVLAHDHWSPDFSDIEARDQETRGVPLAAATPAVQRARERLRRDAPASPAAATRQAVAAAHQEADQRTGTRRLRAGAAPITEAQVRERSLAIQRRWALERGQVGIALDFDEMDRADAQARRELEAERAGGRADDVRTLTRP